MPKSALTVNVRFDSEEFAVTRIVIEKLWAAIEPHIEPWRVDEARAALVAAVMNLAIKAE